MRASKYIVKIAVPMVNVGDAEAFQQQQQVLNPFNQNQFYRSVLIIDGSYADIGAKYLPQGKVDYLLLRQKLEKELNTAFTECWYYNHEPIPVKSVYQADSVNFSHLRYALPNGPQFQLGIYAMKYGNRKCPGCGLHFKQHVQKGVDNGIATKMLSLAYENMFDRIVFLAGDGDFYDSLYHVKNILRKDIWLVGYKGSTSAEIQSISSRVIWLDEFLNEPKGSKSKQYSNPPIAPTSKQVNVADNLSSGKGSNKRKLRNTPSSSNDTYRDKCNDTHGKQDIRSRVVEINRNNRRSRSSKKQVQRSEASSRDAYYVDRVGNKRSRHDSHQDNNRTTYTANHSSNVDAVAAPTLDCNLEDRNRESGDISGARGYTRRGNRSRQPSRSDTSTTFNSSQTILNNSTRGPVPDTNTTNESSSILESVDTNGNLIIDLCLSDCSTD